MQKFEEFSNFLSKALGINDGIMLMIIYSIIIIIGIKVIIKVINIFVEKFSKDHKLIYNFNKKSQIIGAFIIVFFIFLIWESKLQNFITLLSFISAGIALSLRDIIYNFFSGIYIRLTKPFSIEDRIEVDGVEGDVVNINSLNFEVLEVSNKEEGEQSTGIIIHVPNSAIFTSPLKNYVKVFDYIWNELNIKVPLDSNLKQAKATLYKLINQNESVKRIPKKMKNQINNAVGEYRIYYNKLEPIIYTKLKDDYIELSVRYLVDPKKARNLESEIWNKLLEESKKGNIELYSKTNKDNENENEK